MPQPLHRHLATCWYCWEARKELYHVYVPTGNFKSARLECCYCARQYVDVGRGNRVGSSVWMVYPCGWWERGISACICECQYLDMRGYLVEDDDFIFARDRFLMEHVRALRIDYIHGNGIVKFACIRKVDDGNGGHTEMAYSDDEHGPLRVSDIVRVTPFRKILPFVEYFLNHILPKLHALRLDSLILKFLPLLAIKRLSWSNTAFRSSLFGASLRNDATLVRLLSQLLPMRPSLVL